MVCVMSSNYLFTISIPRMTTVIMRWNDTYYNSQMSSCVMAMVGSASNRCRLFLQARLRNFKVGRIVESNFTQANEILERMNPAPSQRCNPLKSKVWRLHQLNALRGLWNISMNYTVDGERTPNYYKNQFFYSSSLLLNIIL